MSDVTIKSFVGDIISINATTAGMGSASAGILGTTAMGDKTTYQLKKSVLCFAEQYQTDMSDEALATHVQEIDGMLQTLCVFSVIESSLGNQLMADLQTLLDTRSTVLGR